MQPASEPTQTIKESALPRFVQDLLASPPARGGGLNNWLFRAARALHPYRTDAEISELLDSAVAGQPLKRGEIERAVERSRHWKPGDGASRSGAWPSLDRKRRGDIIAGGQTFDDLCKLSHVQFEEGSNNAEQVIDALFPGDPYLCCAKSVKISFTKLKSEWCGKLANNTYIVPSVMTGRTGHTQEGKVSARSLTNTGERRFLVIEQDMGTYDEQAAVLLHLAEEAPLALVVFSGRRSLHGWFYCAGQSEERLYQFMRRAVAVGADRATWIRSQLVRMPDGTRDDGNRQRIFYFNPEVIR